MRVCLLLIALLPLAAHASPPPADLILTNGKVFTADPARRMASAIAITGERIVAVGDEPVKWRCSPVRRRAPSTCSNAR